MNPQPVAPALDRRIPIALLLAIGLVYSNGNSGVMLFDDHGNIVNNPAVHSLPAAWSACISGNLRPLTTLTLAMNHAAGGLAVEGYHAFNLLVHASAALVLFGLVRRTILLTHWRAGAEQFAFATALLWAVHPLHTECVTYIVQRAQCLVGLFLFLTLYALVRSVDSPHPPRWWGVAIASCALGLASKQDMVVAPVAALLFDRIFLGRSWREVLNKRGVMHAALFATWIVLAPSIRFALGDPSPAPAEPQPTSMNDRSGVTAGFGVTRITPVQYALTQPGVILHYIGLTIWPYPQSFDYFDWPIAKPQDAIMPAAALLALLAGTGFALLRRPAIGFPMAIFFLALAPTSSILPIDDLVAERRMYLASAAVIVWIVSAWRTSGDALVDKGRLSADARRTVDRIALAVAALSLGLATFARNEDYRSQAAMWADVVAHRPANARAWHNLAVSLVEENRRAEAIEPFRAAARLKPDAGQYAALAQCLVEIDRPAEAASEYEKSIELLSTSRGALRSTPAMLHFNTAKAWADSGRPDRAVERYRDALRLDPSLTAAHQNLTSLLFQRGEIAEGISHAEAAAALEPRSAMVQNNLGLAYARQGKYAEAIAALRKAVELEPDLVSAHDNLGTAYFNLGDMAAAAAAYERALAVQPATSRVIYNLAHAYHRNGNRERTAALYAEARRLDPGRPRVAAQTVWLLAANADPKRCDPVEAVRLAELAVEATDCRDPICLDAAATAYASAGRFPEAVESARAAISLFAEQPRAADAVRNRLRLYERGEPYRDPP